MAVPYEDADAVEICDEDCDCFNLEPSIDSIFSLLVDSSFRSTFGPNLVSTGEFSFVPDCLLPVTLADEPVSKRPIPGLADLDMK